MSASHAALKHELLVRCLDAWTPVALHGHKRAFVILRTPAASLVEAAVRVFGEFADLLARQSVVLVLPPPTPEFSAAAPDGLSVAHDWPERVGPAFGLFDGSAELLSTVANVKGGEVLAFLPSLLDPGTAYQCRAELVDEGGRTEALVFGTSSAKALEQFKDELWALDEFAGIRLRDPGDSTLLDISVRPNVGPLRRMLAARVREAGWLAMSELRAWAVHRTVYRAADATAAVQVMIGSGDFHRVPSTGRLTPATMIGTAAEAQPDTSGG